MQLIWHLVGQMLLLDLCASLIWQSWWQFGSCITHLRADTGHTFTNWDVDRQQMHSQRSHTCNSKHFLSITQTQLQGHALHTVYYNQKFQNSAWLDNVCSIFTWPKLKCFHQVHCPPKSALTPRCTTATNPNSLRVTWVTKGLFKHPNPQAEIFTPLVVHNPMNCILLPIYYISCDLCLLWLL